MSRLNLEELLLIQKSQIAVVQGFWTNLEKLGKNNITQSCLISRMELLENYWLQVVRTHHALQQYDGIATNEYMEEQVFEETENDYILTKSRIKDLLKVIEPPKESVSSSSCCHVDYRDADMPKVNIPEFDGNQADWEDFKDMFKALVHDNKTMPLVKKMHYLKGCLKGKAAQVISRIPLNAEGYETAWDQLLTRFDNSHRRLESYLQCLFEAKPLAKMSASDINASIDTIDQLKRSFQKLGDFENHIYVYALKRRLDEKTKRHWERSLSDSEIPTYEDLKKFLTRWVISLENEEQSSRAKSITNNPKDKKSGRQKERSMNTKKNKCLMCNGNHMTLDTCEKFQKLPSWRRREQVQKAKACFICLSLNHFVRHCSSTIRCQHCQGDHNSLLHLDAAEVTDPQTDSSKPASTSEVASKEQASQIDMTTTTANHYNYHGRSW